MRLDQKVALVTGAASGIGRAIAELFEAEGAKVYATDIRTPVFQTPSIQSVQHDVSSDDDWRRVASRVEEDHGRLDILVNNAGIVGSYEAIDTISMADYDHVIAVNQTGVFLGIRHGIPLLRRSPKGAIVNISSIWGLVGAAGVSAYQASKGAVTCMTKNAALTYAPGIRSNSIHPGITWTGIIEAQQSDLNQRLVGETPLARIAAPIEIAYAALFLASDEASFITGAELAVDGGYTAR